MYKFLIFSVLLIALIDKNYAQKYTTKYDDMNIDDILQSDRLLNNYCKCLMDKGPCTADGTELKNVLREALEEDCAKCSDKQKENSVKVIEFIIKNKPKIWDQLESKYDPEGKYRAKYADRIPTTEKSEK